MAFQATRDWESASGKHFAKEIPKPILTPKETRPSKNKGCSLTFLFGSCLFFHYWREYTSQRDSRWGTPPLYRLCRLSPKAQWGLVVGLAELTQRVGGDARLWIRASSPAAHRETCRMFGLKWTRCSLMTDRPLWSSVQHGGTKIQIWFLLQLFLSPDAQGRNKTWECY